MADQDSDEGQMKVRVMIQQLKFKARILTNDRDRIEIKVGDRIQIQVRDRIQIKVRDKI